MSGNAVERIDSFCNKKTPHISVEGLIAAPNASSYYHFVNTALFGIMCKPTLQPAYNFA